MDQYSLLMALSLGTLVAFVAFCVWQFFAAKRSQKRGHRAEAARVRGARSKHERPAAQPDRHGDGARHPSAG